MPGIKRMGENINLATHVAQGGKRPKKARTISLGNDAGQITSNMKLRTIQPGMEYEIHPPNSKFIKITTDKRPKTTQLTQPMFQTYASAPGTTDFSATAPNQGVLQILDFIRLSDIIGIQDLCNAHQYTSTGTAGGPPGLKEQENSATAADKVFVCKDYRAKCTIRNRGSTQCKIVLEEWLCRRDCDSVSTPTKLYNDSLAASQDNVAATDTAVAAVQWRTEGAATCRVATLSDNGERITGQYPNQYWKKVKSTKISLSSGRTMSYTMVQPKFSWTYNNAREWNDTGIDYIAGTTRILIGYIIGESCGFTATLTIAYGDASCSVKREHFCAYYAAINNAKRRDITYNTAMTGIYPTIGAAGQITTNEETEAAEGSFTVNN